MRSKLLFHSLGVGEARRPRARRSFLRSARRACTAFSSEQTGALSVTPEPHPPFL